MLTLFQQGIRYFSNVIQSLVIIIIVKDVPKKNKVEKERVETR